MTRVFRLVAVIALSVAFATPRMVLGQTEIRARAARLTIGGRLQIQAATSSHGGAPPYETLLRWARFFFGIEVTDFLEGRLLADFARNDTAWLLTPGLSFFVSGRNKIGTNLDIYVPEQGGSDFSFKRQAFLYF